MGLRSLLLWALFLMSVGFGLGLALFAPVLGLNGGQRPRSFILERLAQDVFALPLEETAAAIIAGLLALVAAIRRRSSCQ